MSHFCGFWVWRCNCHVTFIYSTSFPGIPEKTLRIAEIQNILVFTTCNSAKKRLTASLVVDPRQELDDIGVHSWIVWSTTAKSPVDYTILPPVVVLLTDQRAARVTLTCILCTIQLTGTQHVLLQSSLHIGVDLFARVPVDDGHDHLSQNVVVSRVCRNRDTINIPSRCIWVYIITIISLLTTVLAMILRLKERYWNSTWNARETECE